MKRHSLDAIGLHKALLRAHGPQQDWWPGQDDPFEVIVGAILTQRTTWKNAAGAIGALRHTKLLAPEAIRLAEPRELENLIRPAGFYRAKAARLQAFCTMLEADFGGDPAGLLALPLETLRTKLLSAYGIGDETADAILVYAAGKPSFVIDAYTRRLLKRLGWIDGGESYRRLQQTFMEALPADAGMFAEYHALILCHAKLYCRVRPRCATCPLAGHCEYAKHRKEDA